MSHEGSDRGSNHQELLPKTHDCFPNIVISMEVELRLTSLLPTSLSCAQGDPLGARAGSEHAGRRTRRLTWASVVHLAAGDVSGASRVTASV